MSRRRTIMATTLLDVFKRHWWLCLLRGVFAVAFGVMAFGLPERADHDRRSGSRLASRPRSRTLRIDGLRR
jgi:hypothetical protein